MKEVPADDGGFENLMSLCLPQLILGWLTLGLISLARFLDESWTVVDRGFKKFIQHMTLELVFYNSAEI